MIERRKITRLTHTVRGRSRVKSGFSPASCFACRRAVVRLPVGAMRMDLADLFIDLYQKLCVKVQKNVVFLCCVRKQSYLCIVKTKQ